MKLRFMANNKSLSPICTLQESTKPTTTLCPAWKEAGEKHGKHILETELNLILKKNRTFVISTSFDDDGGRYYKRQYSSIFGLLLLQSYFGLDPDYREVEEEYVEFALPKGASLLRTLPNDYEPLPMSDGRMRVAFHLKGDCASAHTICSLPADSWIFFAYLLSPLLLGSLFLAYYLNLLPPSNSFLIGIPSTILLFIVQLRSIAHAREAFYLSVGSWLLPFLLATSSFTIALWSCLLPLGLAFGGLVTYFWQFRTYRTTMKKFGDYWAKERRSRS